MNHNLAMSIARDIQTQLAPACLQIEIAGGLRRGKPDVHDIELVAQPALVPVENLFGDHIDDHSLLDERLAELLDAGTLTPGNADGSRFKQYRVPPSGVALDLFIVLPPAQWGVIMAIRTGPAHYSQWLVTARNKNGAKPSHLQVHDGALWEGDRLIETPTEASFFDALGIPMPAPADRSPSWGQFTEVAQ